MLCNCDPIAALGYDDPIRRQILVGSVTSALLTALVCSVIGTLAIYGVVNSSTALWTQVGLFGGISLLLGITIATSKNIQSTVNKIFIALSVIVVISLPSLFGGLGAVGAIPAYDMLVCATGLGGAFSVVFVGFSSLWTLGACCKNSVDNRG